VVGLYDDFYLVGRLAQRKVRARLHPAPADHLDDQRHVHRHVRAVRRARRLRGSARHADRRGAARRVRNLAGDGGRVEQDVVR
jgi:hypothetical protein